MISDALLLILYNVIGFFLDLLGTFGPAELPAGIENNVATYSQYYTDVNNIFPVGTVLTIIAAQTAIELGILTYRFVKWSWQKIPGIG